jgi:hypothetical protein
VPVRSIRELRITPSADERRKCTPSSRMSCTWTPSIVTCGEASIMMPLAAPVTVKPLSRQCAAP